MINREAIEYLEHIEGLIHDRCPSIDRDVRWHIASRMWAADLEHETGARAIKNLDNIEILLGAIANELEKASS